MPVDGSAWDGNRAMGQCSTAAQFSSICAGRRAVGEPDERQHWALPHHYLGRGPNAAGVRNALARLDQTQGLVNKDAARSHLNSHMSSINPERKSEGASMLTLEVAEVGLGQTQMKSADVESKAGTRQVDFYAAAFGSKDKHGSMLDPKAFDAWLPQFYSAGQSLKMSFNHAAILDDTDPTNVIGFASADAEHVWADDYGLRVSATLNTSTEKGRAVEWQVEHGLLKGASLAFGYTPENVEFKSDHTLIKSVDKVLEAGLVPNPANQNAVLLAMKSEGMIEQRPDVPYMTAADLAEVMASQPRTVQEWHDSLVLQGATCDHTLLSTSLENAQEALEPPAGTLSNDEQARLRRLRYLEATEL